MDSKGQIQFERGDDGAIIPRSPAELFKKAFVESFIPIIEKFPETPTVTDTELLRPDAAHIQAAAQYINFLDNEKCSLVFETLTRFYRSQSLFDQAESCAKQNIKQSQE